MKRIIFAVIVMFVLSPLSVFAGVFEGSYSGMGDAGKWMLFLDESAGTGKLYMYSGRYYSVKYGTASYNSVTGEVSVSSVASPLYDVSSMTASISGSSLSGTWQSNVMGTGTVTGKQTALNRFMQDLKATETFW